MRRIAPQPGPQEAFLACSADIAFYGGAAGGGKSFALLLDPVRFLATDKVRGFTAAVFRRTCPQITNPGGLWDESEGLYNDAGGTPVRSARAWEWPKTSNRIKFSHLQYDGTVHAWQGSQLAYIGFDELTHFSRRQFFYMMSRNRSKCGVRPYIRATMNPDPDSWVREFIDWWIGPDGFPIPERGGVIRWFARDKDKIIWADTKEELEAQGMKPKSFTFIPASVYDNKILLANDEGYLASLESLSLVERGRLLGGNWNIRASAGMVFKKHWFGVVDAAPAGFDRIVRYWDRAATEVSARSTDPDWTVGVKMGVKGGTYYVLDVCRLRGTPMAVQAAMRNCADQDGEECEVWAEEDPGQAGRADVVTLSRLFPDRIFRAKRVTKNKVTRALPASAQVEVGNVKLVRGAWNADFLDELENFSDGKALDDKPDNMPHDDQVDAFSGAFGALAVNNSKPGVSLL